VLAAAAEFSKPLAGSSAATVVIFVPLAFLSGVTGAFFKALSLTMRPRGSSSPRDHLARRSTRRGMALSGRESAKPDGGPLTAWLNRHYATAAWWLVTRPAMVFAAILPLLAIGWIAFVPSAPGSCRRWTKGGFILDYFSTPGTALTETDRLLRQVEGNPQSHARGGDVVAADRSQGSAATSPKANKGDFFIRLKAGPRRPIDAVMSDVPPRRSRRGAGSQRRDGSAHGGSHRHLTAVPQPIEVKLFAADPAVLTATARKVAAAIAKVPGAGLGAQRHQSRRGRARHQIDCTKAASRASTPTRRHGSSISPCAARW